ncbi:hypothetical protein GCM10009853_032420 [Glycomyces scopariae]
MSTAASVVSAIIAGLAVTLLFTVPGYVFQLAFGRGLRRETAPHVFAAATVTAAVIVHAVAFPWTLSWVRDLQPGAVRPWEVAVWALLVLLVVPVLAGSLLAHATVAKRPRWLVSTVRFSGLAHHMQTPDAWTWHFGNGEPAYVRVTLKDGTRLLGYFGMRSLASTATPSRDLYLQRQFSNDKSKAFGPVVPRTAGVWINGDEIAFIEFFGPREEEAAHERPARGTAPDDGSSAERATRTTSRTLATKGNLEDDE